MKTGIMIAAKEAMETIPIEVPDAPLSVKKNPNIGIQRHTCKTEKYTAQNVMSKITG
jgi:hypothetical protein